MGRMGVRNEMKNIIGHIIFWPLLVLFSICLAATPIFISHYMQDRSRWEGLMQERLEDFQWKHRDLVLIARLQQTSMFDEEAFHSALVSLYSTQTYLRWERDLDTPEKKTTKLILDSYVKNLIDIKYKVYAGDSIEYDMMFIQELYEWLEVNL